MRTVKTIEKTTKTMKMVASARLKESQANITRCAPFAETALKIFSEHKVEPQKKSLVVCITSDRGLCGGINAQSVRRAKEIITTLSKKDGNEVEVVCLGDKGIGVMRGELPKQITFNTLDLGKASPNYLGVGIITDKILESNYDDITIIFNKFLSVVQYQTTHTEINCAKTMMEKYAEFFSKYEFPQDMRITTIQSLYEFTVSAALMNGLVQNEAAEQSARMTAMDNASKNALEMLNNLTSTYNKGRQASITKELSEIISGAAAATGK